MHLWLHGSAWIPGSNAHAIMHRNDKEGIPVIEQRLSGNVSLMKPACFPGCSFCRFGLSTPRPIQYRNVAVGHDDRAAISPVVNAWSFFPENVCSRLLSLLQSASPQTVSVRMAAVKMVRFRSVLRDRLWVVYSEDTPILS